MRLFLPAQTIFLKFRRLQLCAAKQEIARDKGEQMANATLPFVAFCRVSYHDMDGIEHVVNVEADTLYEAVAKAVHRFRSNCFDSHPPGPGCQFAVEVQERSPQVYKMPLQRVEQFARYGTARGPGDVLRKKRIRELLSIDE